ncbi:hypothetical protein JW868_00390 [Candidatus Woesearchaeota archaeon]|nr:hypothetical protein [Candidatus Woesearchaeota archaeon]
MDLKKLEEKSIYMIATTPFFSERGCHVRVLDSYVRLSEKNKVTLFTYGLGRTPKLIRSIVRVYNFPWYRKTSPGPSVEKMFYNVFLFFSLFIRSLQKRPDMYYCHLHEGAFIGIVLKLFFRRNVVFNNQGLLVGELSSTTLVKGKKSFMVKLLMHLERFILVHSDLNIVSSEGLKQKIWKLYKIKVKAELDFPNPKIFNPKVKPTNRIKLPKSKKIVVYLGGLRKGKGMDEFITFIPRIDKRFFFLIMGFPVEYCKEVAEKVGVLERVKFTGPIKYEESPAFLKLGDYALSPKMLESGEANGKLYTYRELGLKTVCIDTKENRSILGKLGIYAKDYNDMVKLFEKL